MSPKKRKPSSPLNQSVVAKRSRLRGEEEEEEEKEEEEEEEEKEEKAHWAPLDP